MKIVCGYCFCSDSSSCSQNYSLSRHEGKPLPREAAHDNQGLKVITVKQFLICIKRALVTCVTILRAKDQQTNSYIKIMTSVAGSRFFNSALKMNSFDKFNQTESQTFDHFNAFISLPITPQCNGKNVIKPWTRGPQDYTKQPIWLRHPLKSTKSRPGDMSGLEFTSTIMSDPVFENGEKSDQVQIRTYPKQLHHRKSTLQYFCHNTSP